MAEAESASNDSDETDIERETYAWASQTPTTRIVGKPKRIVYPDRIGDTVEQNGTSFGVIFEDPEVVGGELWVNEAKDGGTTADAVDDDTPRPTDYRVLDSDDDSVSFNKDGNVQSGEAGPNDYVEADDFAEDEVLVWYNGLAGKRIARLLDFNGRPYADWTEDGSYLLKGLFQAHPDWRKDGADRAKLASEDKAPRVARAPILRSHVDIEYDDEGNLEGVDVDMDAVGDDVLVNVSRSGRSYRLHAFDAAEFEDEFGSLDAELPRNDDGWVKDDIESELDMLYTSAADDVLDEAEYSMHMYTDGTWQSEPDNWTPSSTSEVGSFGVSADTGDDDTDDGGLPPQQQQFVDEVVGELDSIHAEKGHSPTPEETFEGGIAGLIGKYESQFSRVPEADDIREAVYEQTEHLTVSDLED